MRTDGMNRVKISVNRADRPYIYLIKSCQKEVSMHCAIAHPM